MTPEQKDTLEQQRAARLARQRRREAEARQRRQTMLRLAMMVGALLMAVALIVWVSTGGPQNATQPTTQPTQPSTQATLPTEPEPPATTEPYTVVHIAATGDLNVTDQVVTTAMNAAGYDFSDTFLDVAPVLAQADLSIVNFEGTLAGAPFGTKTGSAPASLAQTLADMGVDLVQTANSAAIRSGVLGLQSTIAGFQNVGISCVGTFSDAEAFRRSGGYTMVELSGIRIAFVAFTKGMDNTGLPVGSEDCVNVLYEDYTTDYKKIDTKGITKVLDNVAEEVPDLTIALVHWGSEYNENISASQEDVRDLLIANGVDAIIGTHSHLLQQIDYDETAGTLVAWSLGDFYGDASEPATNYSIILDLEITKDNELGVASITGYDITPIYTLKPDQSILGGTRVVRMEQALARYEEGYLGRITDGTYESMAYARKRVDQRIAGE